MFGLLSLVSQTRYKIRTPEANVSMSNGQCQSGVHIRHTKHGYLLKLMILMFSSTFSTFSSSICKLSFETD